MQDFFFNKNEIVIRIYVILLPAIASNWPQGLKTAFRLQREHRKAMQWMQSGSFLWNASWTQKNC